MQEHYKTDLRGLTIAVAGGMCLALAAVSARAENADDELIDEIVTTARLKSGAAALTDERMEVPFSADYLSFEVMARAGDPDIASALRRVPDDRRVRKDPEVANALGAGCLRRWRNRHSHIGHPGGSGCKHQRWRRFQRRK